jgi:DNA-binding transcriptional ArsR family regulator
MDGLEYYLEVFEALSNSHRLRIMAELAEGKQTITDLARKLEMSPPLVFLHLRKLIKAGLIREGNRETINRGGLPPINMLYYVINDFNFVINIQRIREAVKK